MTHSDWIDRLVVALRHRGVDGERVGELVAEIEAYLRDSGSTPDSEFGDPADLADQLVGRAGPEPKSQLRLGVFVVASSIAWLSIFGLLGAGADGRVEVTVGLLVAVTLWTLGMAAFFVWIMRSGGRVWEGRERPRPRIQISVFWVVLVASIVAFLALPPIGLFTVSRTVLWALAGISISYVIAESILQARKARLSVPPAASPHGEDLIRRWTGIAKLRTGWRLGREAYRDVDGTE